MFETSLLAVIRLDQFRQPTQALVKSCERKRTVLPLEIFEFVDDKPTVSGSNRIDHLRSGPHARMMEYVGI